MLKRLHQRPKLQLLLGLLIGLIFGFLLDKGGVTHYRTIMGQLLLRDFRVMKIIFSAIITGSVGLQILRSLGYVEFNLKPCRLRANIIGGLIFGLGFGLLGYCPGTAAGGVGVGSIHAFIGVVGILLGAGLFARLYPRLADYLANDSLGKVSISELLKVKPWVILMPLTVIIVAAFIILEHYGL